MPSTRHLAALAALTLTLGVALAGCTPGAEQLTAPTVATLGEALGIDEGPVAAELDTTADERLEAAQATWDETLALVDAELDAAAFVTLDTSTDPAATGTVRTVGTWSPRTGMFATGTPGLDVPIVREGSSTTTGTADGHPTTTTASSSTTTVNQIETTVDTASTTATLPNGELTESMSFEASQAACRGDRATGEFEAEWRRTVSAPGQSAEVAVEVTGEFRRNDDGTLALTNLVLRTGGTATPSDGGAPTGRTITTRAEITSWDTSGYLSGSKGTVDFSQLPEGVSHGDAMNASMLGLAMFENQNKRAADRADELRAPFTAWVIDVASGEELHEARLDAASAFSSVAPESGTGRTTFTLTAKGRPTYEAHVATATERGGHTAFITWNAHGWRFSGVTYSYTVPSHLGPIPTSVTWSGEVCGDITDQWDVIAQFSSAYGSPTVALPMGARKLEDIPAGTHAGLYYQEIENPEEGQLPFRLWIDEHNPEIIPTDHRVEIVPEPFEAACVS